MSSVSLIGPLVFAILLPVLVWWVASIFARGVALFSSQFEIDRRLRSVVGLRRTLLWMPWRREALAFEHMSGLPAGAEREQWVSLLRQHARAMDLQAGWAVLNLAFLSVAWGLSLRLSSLAVIAGTLLVVWRWRWRSRWKAL